MKTLRLISIATLIFSFAILVSCKKNKEIETPAPNPISGTIKSGNFGISYIEGLGKKENFASIGDTITFNLGDLKSSKEFYFLLNNVGDKNIFNISITSSNSQFIVSPAQIEQLLPSHDASILPAIKLGVNHGVALNGVGYTVLMNKGINSSIVKVKGSTTNANNDTLNIQLVCKVTVDAKVLDIELKCGTNNTILDLGNRSNQQDFNGFGGYFYRLKGDSSQRRFSIKNTGNILIQAKISHMYNAGSDNELSLIQEINIEPGIEKFFKVPSNQYIYPYYGSNCTIYLNSENTISDYHKFKIYEDGTSRLTISWFL